MFDLSGTMVCDRNPLSHLPKPINPIFHKSNNPIWGEASKYLYRPRKKTQSVCPKGASCHARGDNRELLGAADGRE